MSEAQTAARAQQRIEELCAAALRALSGQADLHYRGRRLHRGRTPLPLYAPHLHPRLEEDDFASFRGAADGYALRLRGSDQVLHRNLCPSQPVARLLFEMLEQYRVESNVDAALPGVRANLRHRFEAWLQAFHRSGLTDTERGILLFTVAQIARSRVTGEPPLEATEDLMEATRAGIVPAIGHALAGLRRHRHDQRAYAQHALVLAQQVAEMIASVDADGSDPAGAGAGDDAERAAFSLVMDTPAQQTDGVTVVHAGRSGVLQASDGGYRIFTTAYDRELRAATLVRPALLQEQRAQLDRRIAALGVNLSRLARDLKALLAQPTREGWHSAQEEGLIDGRRLAQLIAAPTERRLFRTERVEPQADAVLAFLIDCSGSMREHIESVAMIVDVMARALEQAGVASEILGFTTGAWNGGRAQRDWIRAGRPAHPGRLNEVEHLIFKDADTSWRRARPGIAALLKADLFKEGIDGEAVDWACDRLQRRGEAHKLLVVVSDGCPMDAATHLANDSSHEAPGRSQASWSPAGGGPPRGGPGGGCLLDRHLQDVVARHEQAGAVQVFGLGVGLDLSPYYSRAQALELSALHGQAVFRDLLELLASRRWR